MVRPVVRMTATSSVLPPKPETGIAWALTGVAVTRGHCSLPELVAAADGLNHALLVDAEAESAFAKLVASGLLRQPSDLVFELTDDGSELIARRHGNHFTQVNSVLSLLEALPVRTIDFQLPSGALDKATSAYLAESRRH